MINPHDFQQAAKKFRGGRITLAQFTDLVFQRGAGGGQPSKTAVPNAAPPSVAEPVAKGKLGLTMGLSLRDRPREAHKGDFGRILAIGGSVGMAGAISLTGLAALRSGSGLVKVAVPEKIQATIAGFNPCLMTVGFENDGDGFHGSGLNSLLEHSAWADVIALGPGLGRGEAQKWIVKNLYQQIQQPMVVDADGINTLVDAETDLAEHPGQRILTPHPGEFQRLIGSKITNRTKLEEAAISLAKSKKLVIVLKGKGTLVTDGEQTFRNDTGNPGMATAGSGDVLTGVITSLVGQGVPAFEACSLGVNVHGVAGDFAAESVGETSLIASDIIEFLPNALKRLANTSAVKIGF